MKLWFKLFISSVLIVITAVNVTMTWMLSTNLSAMLANERENAAVHHEYLCTLIKDAVAYERLSTDAFMVTEDEIANIAEKIFMAQLREGSSAVLFDESQSAITDNTDEFSISDMLSAANDEKTVSSAIKKIQTENGEDYLIVCCSLIRLEGKNYYLTDSRNISEIYLQNREQERFSQLASIISTVLFSVVLLIVTKLFLRPLDRVNHTLKVIAGGNYSKRLKVKGSEEFRSLSENVNLMAQSVEENYNKIQSVADERKQFIDSLSHEIKTPLTSVLGFAELMRMKSDLSSDEVLDYSSIIAEEAARLRSLSGKMMELVSTGNGSLEKHFVRLDELLTEISVVFEPIIKAKCVKLNVVTEPVVIMADRDLFKSLLYNLVDNAVKASPENETVSFSCKEEGGFAVITVSDHGRGIDPDEQKRVFEPFYMTDKARSRKAGGAGLGLALCAEIAKKHEAVIRLKSEVNKGTAITVTVKAGGAGYDENNK